MLRKSFTLVEIMIVVAIIGLLAAIAVPSFLTARETSRKNACINNLRLIDHAKLQWATSHSGSTATDTPDDATIEGYLKNGHPSCPAGGSYTYGNMSTLPVCSLATSDEHKLPAAGANAGG